MRFRDDGDGHGTLRSRDGKAAYTGRHVPYARTWWGGRRWPAVVEHDGRMFVDTQTFDRGFRVYEEAPLVASFS